MCWGFRVSVQVFTSVGETVRRLGHVAFWRVSSGQSSCRSPCHRLGRWRVSYRCGCACGRWGCTPDEMPCCRWSTWTASRHCVSACGFCSFLCWGKRVKLNKTSRHGISLQFQRISKSIFAQWYQHHIIWLWGSEMGPKQQQKKKHKKQAIILYSTKVIKLVIDG